MIEYALLIMLGFCISGLIALLLAPTLWQRAVRLTTKRLEATMPMSLSDIEADKDLLRASYAIRLRRMEAALNKARDKSANQLVEISRHQMRIAELNSGIDLLNAQLDERRNAANVFESTIRKRFPELESKVAVAQAALDERAGEIADLIARLRRREEALEMAQRSAALQQDEIRQLRDTLERTGADTTGRFKKRASQWTLDEYRSEYDRLNGELSRIREQLILAQERENRQVAVLRTELQQLAERIMVSATAEPKPVADWREAERQQPSRAAPPPVYRSQAASPSRRVAPQPVTAPRPWPGDRTAAKPRNPAAAPPAVQTGAKAEPQIERKASTPSQPDSQEKAATPAVPVASRDASRASPAVSEPAAGRAVTVSESEDRAARESLKSLLDRGAKLAGKDILRKTASAPAAMQPEAEPARKTAEPAESGKAEEDAASGPTVAEATAANASATTAKPEPKLDQVFREILEGRNASSPEAAAKSPAPNGSEQKSPDPVPQDKTEATADSPGSPESSKTQTLLDRLRDIQERQTG
ncbi:MAG: hypothetical protein ACFCUR_08680 [Rhodomicrobiaceae bacterium]